MTQNITVLGAGLVGGVIARELAQFSEFSVTVADRDAGRLEDVSNGTTLETCACDLSNEQVVRDSVAAADLVISAVPGFMGYQTLKTVIESEKNVVDIAFFAEDPFSLGELAREKGVTAIVDCGVAPGLSSLLVGQAYASLDSTESVLVYVGGLPKTRVWPFEYKAVFSPIDVIEEYIRPARYLQNGSMVIREALSEPELMEFDQVGTLEAFNTDGLRTLATTINAPNQKEKTLRYPGHIEKMAMLREMGLFSSDPIDVNGVAVKPVDMAIELLKPLWKLQEGEEDVTVLRVLVQGTKDGQLVEHRNDMIDHYDRENNVTSMARTTGYAATVMARELLAGRIEKRGITVLEELGQDQKFAAAVLEELQTRHGVCFKSSVKPVQAD